MKTKDALEYWPQELRQPAATEVAINGSTTGAYV